MTAWLSPSLRKYGRLGGPEYCRLANESVIVVVQVEHIDAVNNLDEILAVHFRMHKAEGVLFRDALARAAAPGARCECA